jgi:hypothetical protein
MSLNNGQLHGFALVGTLVLSAGLLISTVYLAQADATVAAPLKKMITIEAQLARKSTKQRQPQKELKTAPPEVKPEGVSRDENKAPIDKKPDEPKKPKLDDKPIDLSKFKRPVDDDPQTGGEPTTDIGQFDGSKKGFAPLNTGDPYWRELNADFREVWEIPTISKVNGAVIGCVRIEANGEVSGAQLDPPSGDEILDDSVQRALKATQQARNQKPQPVPTEQLSVIKEWVCFRFNPNPS